MSFMKDSGRYRVNESTSTEALTFFEAPCVYTPTGCFKNVCIHICIHGIPKVRGQLCMILNLAQLEIEIEIA